MTTTTTSARKGTRTTEWISVDAVADRLAISARLVRQLRAEGVLPSRIGAYGLPQYPWPDVAGAYRDYVVTQAAKDIEENTPYEDGATRAVPLLQDNTGRIGALHVSPFVSLEMAASLLGCTVENMKQWMIDESGLTTIPCFHHPAGDGRDLFLWRDLFGLWRENHDEELRMRIAEEAAAPPAREPTRRSPALREELCEAYGVTVLHLSSTGSWLAMVERDGTKHELVWPTRAGAEDAMLNRLGAPTVGEVRHG